MTILKNMKVNGKDDIPYIMENWNVETTNQMLNHDSFFEGTACDDN